MQFVQSFKRGRGGFQGLEPRRHPTGRTGTGSNPSTPPMRGLRSKRQFSERQLALECPAEVDDLEPLLLPAVPQRYKAIASPRFVLGRFMRVLDLCLNFRAVRAVVFRAEDAFGQPVLHSDQFAVGQIFGLFPVSIGDNLS